MARSFTKVYNQILEVAPEALSSALEKSAGFWAPEVAWSNLSQFVNRWIYVKFLDTFFYEFL